MADHRAEDITTTLVSLLTGLATTGARIYRDRVYELSEAQLPALLVYVQADSPRQPSALAAPGLLDCDLQIVVEAVVKSSAAQVDTTLNQIRYEVGQAIHEDVTLGLPYVMHSVEGQSLPELQPDADQMVGRLRMDWTVLYRRSRGQNAPAFSSAAVLVSGTSIEVEFSDALTSGSATTGFTWSGGTIISGSYSGTTLTLVVVPYLDASPNGTLSYSGGTLAGAGGPVGDFASETVTNNSAFAGAWAASGNSASFPGGTTTVTKFGASALNSTDIVIVDDVSDLVRVSRFTSPNWGALGSTYSIGSLTVPGVAAMDSGTVAVFKSNTTAGLFSLTWNGSAFSASGSQLNITGSNQGIALCRLSSTRVVLVDSQADYMRTYDWNGSAWSAVGNSLSLGGINGEVRIDALTATLVVMSDAGTNAVSLYSFDGTDWSLVASSTLSVDTVLGVATARPCVCAMNASDIVIGGNTGKIQAMRWSGTAWATLGSSYSVPNTSSVGTTALVSLGSQAVAFMRASTSNSFLRRLVFQ